MQILIVTSTECHGCKKMWTKLTMTSYLCSTHWLCKDAIKGQCGACMRSIITCTISTRTHAHDDVPYEKMSSIALFLSFHVLLSSYQRTFAQSDDEPFILVEDDVLPVCDEQQFVTFNGTHLVCRNMSEWF